MLTIDFQRNISGIVLHILNALGTGAVHLVWHLVGCVPDLAECDCKYFSRIDLLPIVS